MKFIEGNEILGLPENFKFGIELEAYNVKTKGKNSLYKGESAEYIKNKNWHMATKYEESLVGKGGAEVVSPILKDTEKNWKDIQDICEQMKKYPGKDGDKVIADDKCGLHVHFDSECLTKDPKRMKNFLKIYAESEELIYKMCNDKNDPIRKGAINRKIDLSLLCAWRKGMAAPIGKKILEKIENGTLKVSYKKFNKLRMIAGKIKIDERRYHGLNLTNIGNPKKNTIEFRMANGTLDQNIIKQNVYLYGSILDTSIKITENPEKYEKKLEEFYKTDISEEEKANKFLNLVFENEDDKKIYFERWQSVKNDKVFSKNDKKAFSQNRFQREEFKKIAERTPAKKVKKTYDYIKHKMQKTKDIGENEYER